MLNHPINAVIFDFNGTLFLDNDKHVQAWSEISRRLRGTPITEEELHLYCNGRPNHMIIRYLAGGKENPQLEAEYSVLKEQIYRRLCREDPENFHLIQGAESVFDRLLQAGIPFTIASASIKDNIDFFVKSFHLDRWIDPETICYNDGSCATKKEMLEKACRILKTDPEKTTIVEDSISGVQAAQQAGIHDIRIINSSRDEQTFSRMEDVTQIMETMEEMIL